MFEPLKLLLNRIFNERLKEAKTTTMFASTNNTTLTTDDIAAPATPMQRLAVAKGMIPINILSNITRHDNAQQN